MKNISKIAFTLLIASSILFSCSKDDIVSDQQNTFEDVNDLSEDASFTKLIEENIDLMSNISNLERAKELLSKGDNLSEAELNELSNSLGFSDLNNYVEFYKNQNVVLKELNKKYDLTSYDEATIQSLAIENLNNNSSMQRSNNCERIRVNCIASAAAAATVGHIACGAWDLTIIGGILCHSAVVVAQAVASDTCNANAEECAKTQISS
ncbi:hypothetical protein [Aquimarina sp. 2201CG5-10]|uniref:hypothetical protein n=1 Tax=Aquimarina callyspongiae TaxID=3098150 RepID=UPI002AB519F6|nr:hypothetical protein [Aquimarina sp. 2201CG5-10]MDY8138623.1 hypothetical protein [Aquimarina sp. 2201CG5-10]